MIIKKKETNQTIMESQPTALSLGNKNVVDMKDLILDLQALMTLMNRKKEFNHEQKNFAEQKKQLDASIIQKMRNARISYIDESGKGSGPFWCLTKEKKGASWNEDRIKAGVTEAFEEFKKHPELLQRRSDELAEEWFTQQSKKIKKEVEKSIGLNRTKRISIKTYEELEKWINE
jgi:hypothetical protein